MNRGLAALAAATLLASCMEGVPDKVVKGVAVVTQHRPDADFTGFATFSIDPTVAVVDQTGTVATTSSVDGTRMASAISANMVQRGYTEVAWRGNNTVADLQIKMEALLGSAEVYYPGYCGWYPYYYCYPGWSYAGSYNFGTVVITMGDTKHAAAGGELSLVWTTAMYGILASYYTPGVPSSGANVNWPRIQEAVNRAFADSPYIKK